MADLHPYRTSAPTREPDGPAVADSSAQRDAPYRAWVGRARAGDVAAAALAAAAAKAVRFGVAGSGRLTTSDYRLSYVALGVIVTLAWPLFVGLAGGYELRTLLVGVEELRRVVRSGIYLLAALGFFFFATNVDLSRGYVGALIPLVAIFTGLWRFLLRTLTTRQQARGSGHHNVVAVGPVLGAGL